MSDFFIDFHCHPSIKPYGRSFALQTVGQNDANRQKRNSLWYYDSPSLFDKGLQMLTGIAKFTQADCTTLSYGNARIICVSLYPIEKGFFNNDLGHGFISDLADNFITSVSKERVDYIQGIKNYYEDVVREYKYYQQLDGVSVETDSGTFKYILAKSFDHIDNYTAQHPDDKSVIFLIVTIEGLHVLHNDISSGPDEASVLANLKDIKSWPHSPFFVTFAHHFYNHLCGHARSLTGLVGNVTDQKEGMNTGFTPLGKKVLQELLSNQTSRRIYIDIKHMSAQSRKEYFATLQSDYASEKIPVIISHGAANGLRSMDEPVADGKETAYKLLAEDINFYDNEILMVAKTHGIIGLQLDERRIASESTLKNIKHSLFLNKIRHYRSELLWNQLQHIVELLDRNDLFAWDVLAIGSDFDGIINPLNGFLTSETMPMLQQFLERHVFNYMNGRGREVLKSYNQISAAEIVSRVFYTNGMEFLKKWYVS